MRKITSRITFEEYSTTVYANNQKNSQLFCLLKKLAICKRLEENENCKKIKLVTWSTFKKIASQRKTAPAELKP
ncbi:hypothetical protein PF586_07545 [Lactobacillus delbrueckii]|uniref:Transposase n=1 Tax=Lactobacillus delbrueckii TaxID=1584 RepID=A0AAW5YW15_9LACO|nr:hypothetical protein [Lactobacillus delbrueckii]MDA3768306.1 hypothetical protein [Lactobacillus delbrueckii]